MWKDGASLRPMAHVLLNSEIVNAEIKMERRRHAHRAEIRGAVRSCSNVVHLGKAGDFSQVGNTSSVHDGRANVIDKLLLNQLLAIVDAFEYFPNSQWRCRLLADY